MFLAGNLVTTATGGLIVVIGLVFSLCAAVLLVVLAGTAAQQRTTRGTVVAVAGMVTAAGWGLHAAYLIAGGRELTTFGALLAMSILWATLLPRAVNETPAPAAPEPRPSTPSVRELLALPASSTAAPTVPSAVASPPADTDKPKSSAPRPEHRDRRAAATAVLERSMVDDEERAPIAAGPGNWFPPDTEAPQADFAPPAEWAPPATPTPPPAPMPPPPVAIEPDDDPTGEIEIIDPPRRSGGLVPSGRRQLVPVDDPNRIEITSGHRTITVTGDDPAAVFPQPRQRGPRRGGRRV